MKKSFAADVLHPRQRTSKAISNKASPKTMCPQKVNTSWGHIKIG